MQGGTECGAAPPGPEGREVGAGRRCGSSLKGVLRASRPGQRFLRSQGAALRPPPGRWGLRGFPGGGGEMGAGPGPGPPAFPGLRLGFPWLLLPQHGTFGDLTSFPCFRKLLWGSFRSDIPGFCSQAPLWPTGARQCRGGTAGAAVCRVLGCPVALTHPASGASPRVLAPPTPRRALSGKTRSFLLCASVGLGSVHHATLEP